jgi:acyl-CoA thioesterase FadM
MTDLCVTPYRVWPTDLDVLKHVNNGVYFSMMDLGRIDMMLRSGSYKTIDSKGWYPVVTAETLKFKKSLTVFQKFEIHTQIVGWDEKSFYIEQSFVADHKLYVSGVIKGQFLKRQGGKVSTRELLSAVSIDYEGQKLNPEIKRWSDSVEKIFNDKNDQSF